MKRDSYRILILALAAAGAFLSLPAAASSAAQGQVTGAQAPGPIDWISLPGAGKKVKLNDDYTFAYEFSQRPQMGTVILVVRVFDKTGAQVLPFKITGRSDMPSMRGAHDSGEIEFRTNKANNYLLPVNIVMPGDWEVRLTFQLNDKAVFYGSLRFDV